MLSKLKKPAFFLFLLLLLLFAAGQFVNIMFRDQIEQQLIHLLNRQLKTGAEFSGEVEISIFSNFPSASLHFGDFLVKDAFRKADTLLYAEDFAFVFDIRDLFSDQVNVQELSMTNGKLMLKVDKKGKNNWDIWKTESSGKEVVFDQASFSNLYLSFYDQFVGNDLEMLSEYGEWSGNYDGNLYKALLTSRGRLIDYRSDGTSTFSSKGLAIDMELTGDMKKEHYDFAKCDLELEGNDFSLSGWFDIDKNDTDMDLRLSGPQLNLAHFLSLMPKEQLTFLEDFEPYGKMNFEAHMKGVLNKRLQPAINANFSLTNGELDWKKGGQEIDEINLKGNFSKTADQQLSEGQISIPEFTCEVNNHPLEQSFVYVAGEKPSLNWHSNGVIDLLFFQEALEEMGINGLSGLIALQNMHIIGRPKANGELSYQSTGEVEVSGMEWEREGFPATSLALDARFTGNDLEIEGLTLATPASVVQLSGELKGWLPYLLYVMSEDSVNVAPKVVVDLDVKSPGINLKEWLPSLSEAQQGEVAEGEEQAQVFDLSPFSGYINLKIDEIFKGKTKAEHLWGIVCWEGRDFKFEELLFQAFGGEGRFSATYHKKANGEWKGQSQIRIGGLDLQQLMLDTENLGLEDIQAENLEGYLSVNSLITTEWDRKWRMKKQRLKMYADVEIDELQLINFKPLMAMMDDKKERYKQVSFSPLKNQIYIKDWQMHIPRMTIASNHVNIDMSAMHTLENSMYYHFKVDLMDYFGKRFFNKNRGNKSVEKNDRGGGNYYFSVFGKPESSRVEKSSKKKVEQKFRKDKRIQPKNLRDMLHKEYDFSCEKN